MKDFLGITCRALQKSFEQSQIASIFSFDWFAQFCGFFFFFFALCANPTQSIVWQLISLSPGIISPLIWKEVFSLKRSFFFEKDFFLFVKYEMVEQPKKYSYFLQLYLEDLGYHILQLHLFVGRWNNVFLCESCGFIAFGFKFHSLRKYSSPLFLCYLTLFDLVWLCLTSPQFCILLKGQQVNERKDPQHLLKAFRI